MRYPGLVLGIALAWLTGGSEAGAWTVGSSITHPCHERLGVAQYEEPWRGFLDPGLQPPSDDTWSKVLDSLVGNLPLDTRGFSDRQRFMLLSLLVGLQVPDTGGYALTNIENLHSLVGDPSASAQHQHALRAPEEDGPEGNLAAVEGTKIELLREIEQARRSLRRPWKEQIVRVPYYLDFYGQIELQVHEPMFHVGKALHTFQDSFSHDLRDEHDGYRSIVHVMNFIDALRTDFDASRDGLPHSAAMDDCTRQDLQALVRVTEQASHEFMVAVGKDLSSGKDDGVEAVLDKWMQLREGCGAENGYCHNERLLAVARQETTKPVLAPSVADTMCATDPGRTNGDWSWFLGVVGLVVLVGWYRRARDR